MVAVEACGDRHGCFEACPQQAASHGGRLAAGSGGVARRGTSAKHELCLRSAHLWWLLGTCESSLDGRADVGTEGGAEESLEAGREPEGASFG